MEIVHICIVLSLFQHALQILKKSEKDYDLLARLILMNKQSENEIKTLC